MEREVNEGSLLINEENLCAQSPRTQSLREREIFHDTFSFLIKLVNKLELNQMHFLPTEYVVFILIKLFTFLLCRGAPNGIVVAR